MLYNLYDIDNNTIKVLKVFFDISYHGTLMASQ